MKNFIVIILLLGSAGTCCNQRSITDDPVKLGQLWCDCIDKQRDTLTSENILNIWKVCDEQFMDSSKYFFYYYKNMGKVAYIMEISELERLSDLYDKFIEVSDSLCPMSRSGDSLIAPKKY
jgi:hypothetical protein